MTGSVAVTRSHRARPLLAAALIMALAHVAAAQRSNTALSVERAAVQRARAVFSATNAERATLRSVKRRIFGMSSEGAEAVAWYRGGELRKIEFGECGAAGCTTQEMYFDGGQLLFVYSRSDTRHPPAYKLDRREEARLYFANGHLVRWLDNAGRPRARDAAAFSEEEEDVSRTLKVLMKALASADEVYEVDDDPSAAGG